MDTFLDNGLFAAENNILHYIFTKEECDKIYKDIAIGAVDVIQDLFQSENDINIPVLNTSKKICLLSMEIDTYISSLETRDSIYSRVYQKCKNLTFDTFLYEVRENPSHYDFKNNWKKYLENNDEIEFLKAKAHLSDNEVNRLLSIMKKAFIEDETIESEDDDDFFDSIMDNSRFRCWIACIITSLLYIAHNEEQTTEDANMFTVLTAEKVVNKNKELYNKWLEAVGKNGIRNQIKVNSQKLFEAGNHDNNILSVFLVYYFMDSNDWTILFTEKMEYYCDSMVKKIKLEEFLRNHQYGREFVEEYKKYCSTNHIEPKININSILMLLERDDSSYNRKRYYRLSEKRISKYNGDLSDEYNALSKLYDALKKYGCSPKEECKQLFVYRFSGICLQGTQIDREFGLENKMEWEWSKKQILPVIIRLLYQEWTVGPIPYTDIASFFENENPKGFSSKCKHVGKKSLTAICNMLKQCGFTGFDDIYQQIIEEKKNSKNRHL